MTPINNFLINNHGELIDKISKWNLTNKLYPENFPKDKVIPLLDEYISIEDYRLKVEPLFYLECWEPFKTFNSRLNKKEIDFEENAVSIEIDDFETPDLSNEDDESLLKCNFTILMPNYFIYGYQGMHFSDRVRQDSDIERRTSGDIKKHDILFIARVDKTFKKIYYKTVVMSNIQKDYDKNLVSMFNRTNLYHDSPVICTKLMTKEEINEFKDELNKKREKGSRWICCHVMTFGTVKKEFKTIDLLVKLPTLNIRKEITTGKNRNENSGYTDRSIEILNSIMCDYNLNEQLSNLILKIYKNISISKEDKKMLINLLKPPKINGKYEFSPDTARIINNIYKGIFPFPLEDKKILYKAIFSKENQTMSKEIENLLYDSDKKMAFDKTVKEIIQQYGLNTTQASILAKVKKEKFLSMIQGPPGTGKTKMILALIYQELREKRKFNKNSKVLVCAPSNAACNEIAHRLKKENINTNIVTVRFIADDNIDNAISHITADEFALRKLYHDIITVKKLFDIAPAFINSKERIERLEIHNENIQTKVKELVKNRKILNEVIKQSERGKEKVIDRLYQRICLIENELDEYIQKFIDYLMLIDDESFEGLKDSINETAKKCKIKVFEEADVIIATLSSSNSEYFKHVSKKFTLLVVDEASQASELTTLIPFCHNIPKSILIGDPKQLPPTILSTEAIENNYGRSLFQRLQENSPDSVHLLNIQYRMHPKINKLSNRCFYSNNIINGENVKSSKWQKAWCKNPDFGPLMFYDVDGVTNFSNNSLTNVTEATQVLNFITQLLESTPKIIFSHRIAVISPYRAQVLLIRSKLRDYYKEMLNQLNLNNTRELEISGEKVLLSDENKELLKKANILDFINVNTVDSFQGQESDIVILSCVRSDTKNVGFLSDKRRLNVAITRARFSLIIFGNSKTLSMNKYWNTIITEIKEDKCFKPDAKEYFEYSRRFPKNLFPKNYFK